MLFVLQRSPIYQGAACGVAMRSRGPKMRTLLQKTVLTITARLPMTWKGGNGAKSRIIFMALPKESLNLRIGRPSFISSGIRFCASQAAGQPWLMKIGFGRAVEPDV